MKSMASNEMAAGNAPGSQSPERVLWGKLLPVGLASIALAVVANVAFYFLADALGWMSREVQVGNPENPGAITAGPVAIFTALLCLLGLGVYALLGRFTRKPLTIFLWIAVVVLVLQILPTLTVGAPMAMVVALNIMHVIAGVIVVIGFTRFAGERVGR